MVDIHIDERLSCEADSNAFHMNYAGMRVCGEEKAP